MKNTKNNKPLKIAVLVTHFFAAIFMLTAQNTSLPVGSIPGEIDVSPMGAATYTIPIEVVPGTQGIQPNLSIVYNSMSGMGQLGMKWSLAGLSAITRCGQNPYYDDGRISAVQFDRSSNVRFTLDGARLLQVCNGVYGDNDVEYATELETFTRVISYGNAQVHPPVYFRAFTDDGSIIEYGYANNSKQQFISGDAQTTLNWFVNKITDVNGNYMTFHYGQENGEIWINEIQYTMNLNSTFTQPYAKVKFSYCSLPDNSLGKNTCFVGGYAISQTKLLDTITVSYKDTVVRQYIFNYNLYDSNERTPHLKEIILIGENNAQLNSTTIIWGENYSSIIEPQPISGLPNDFPAGKILPGDFNGDGYTDFIVYDIGSGSTKSWYLYLFNPTSKVYVQKTLGIYTPEHGDALFFAQNICGEGKDNLIIGMKKYNASLKLYYHEFKLYSPDVGSIEINTLKYDYYNSITFGDFDGNGITDIMCIEVSIETPKAGRPIAHWALTFYSKHTDGNMPAIYFDSDYELVPIIQIVDVSGNGKSAIRVEYTTVKEQEKYVIYELGTSGFVGIEYDPYGPFYHRPSVSFYGDVNGDGVKDIIVAHPCAYNPYWELFIAKGDRTYIENDLGAALDLSWLGAYNNCNKVNPVLFADLNGDGKEDIIQGVYWRGSTSFFRILLSKKCENDQYQYTPIMLSNIQGKYNSLDNWTIGDVNGDGLPDIILLDNEDLLLPIRYISFNQDNDYEFVKEITDGMEKTIQLNYKHQYCIAQSKHQEKFYPNLITVTSQKTFLSVVDSVRVSNGIGNGFNTLKYKFSTLVYSLPRRILLGFNEFVCINPQENKRDSLAFNYYHYYNTRYQVLVPNVRVSFDENIKTSITTYPFSLWELDNYTRFIYRNDIEVYNYLTKNLTKTVHTYNNQGRLIKNVTETYDYVPNPSICMLSETTTYFYKGICLSGQQRKTVPEHIITAQQYNNGPIITNTTTYTYGELGRIASVQKANSDGSITTSYGNYLPSGVCQLKTVSAQDCTPRSEIFGYDVTQRFTTSIKNALNHEANFSYDAKTGNKKTETDPNGLTTTYNYDAFGNLTLITYPDNTKTNTSLQWYSNPSFPNAKYSVTTKTDAKPDITVYYDLLGREVCRLDDGSYYETQYNNLGQVTKTSYPFLNLKEKRIWRLYTYDTYGRKDTETAPYINLSYNYSNNNRTVTTTLNSVTSSKTHDALGRIIDATDAGGTITYNYAVITEGRKPRHKTTITAVNATTEIKTDLWGNRLYIKDPDAEEIISTYNGFGELMTQTDANGNLTTYQYDQLGRVEQKKFIAPDYTTQTIDYVYDYVNSFDNLKGKLYQINMNGAKSESFSYDNFGRLWFYDKAIDNRNYGFFYEYTPEGQLQTLTYPDGYTVNYTYTSVGKLNEIRRIDDRSNSLIYKVNLRNKYNQTTSCEYGNGVMTEYDYNLYGLLTRINTGKKESGISIEQPNEEKGKISQPILLYYADSTILNYRYKYNDKGLMSSRSECIVNRLETYNYDDLDRLTGIASGTMRKPPQPSNLFTYSSNGNITYNPNVGNYIYDGNKPHAVTKIEPINEKVISANQCEVTYNFFNQPTKITEGEYELNLFYGANQQRNKAQLYGENVAISTRYYINKYYEEETRVTRPPTPSRSFYYIYGDNGIVALHVDNVAGYNDSIFYVHTDHLGSYCAITNANKQVVLRNHFDPWGNYVVRDFKPYFNGELPLTHRGFTGHEHYPYFQIINMNGRLYDPVIGRFFSPDKYVANSSFTQDFNRYSYARNNPLMYTDPSGEFIWAWVPVIAWAGGMLNMYMHRNDAGSLGQALGHFAIGAIASGASAAAGIGVAAAMPITGFAGAFFSGFAGGFTGGFISGAGNSWMLGASFGQGLGMGLQSGFISGVISGLTAGMVGGIQAKMAGGRFGDGYFEFYDAAQGKATVTREKALELRKSYNSNVLSDNNDIRLASFSKEAYKLETGDFIKTLTTKLPTDLGYDYDLNMVLPDGTLANGLTRGYVGKHPYDIYIAAGRLSDYNDLYATLGHEIIHAIHLNTQPWLGRNMLSNWTAYSEAAACNFSFNVYLNAGRYSDAMNYLKRGIAFPDSFRTILHCFFP